MLVSHSHDGLALVGSGLMRGVDAVSCGRRAPDLAIAVSMGSQVLGDCA